MPRMRMGVKHYLVFAFSLGVMALFPQGTEKSISEKRIATLKYGIDQDVKDLLKTLESEKNDDFNEDILSVLTRTRNQGLKRSIFDFFSARIWKGAETQAIADIKNRGLEEEQLVIGALNYCASIKSKEALSSAIAIFDERETGLMPSLIKLAGKAGGPEEERLLLKFYDSEESTESNKQDIVLALGDIGSRDSVDFLIKLLGDENGKKFIRMYACDSLSRLGNSDAVPTLIKAANDPDSNVRVYAVSALGKFDNDDAKSMVIEALRDSYDQVRISAAKSAGSLKLASAEDFLRYRAENDKSTKVREEAFKALSEIGSDGAFDFLTDTLKRRNGSEVLRLLSLSLLLGKKRTGSYQAIRETMVAESKEKIQSLYQRMAKAVSESETPELSDLAASFLDSPDFIVRLYGIEWVRKNKASALKPRLEALSSDKVESVRKRAAETAAGL